MAKRQVFYSFYYDNDVFRTQQVRNIGAVEGNIPVSKNAWETVKYGGENSIKRWIDENLKQKSCLVVLIGTDTSKRKWVKYEIEKAWADNKGVVGIYIHNLNCPVNGKCAKGANPFDFTYSNGSSLSSLGVKTFSPSYSDAYNDIKNNLVNLIEEAIEQRRYI